MTVVGQLLIIQPKYKEQIVGIAINFANQALLASICCNEFAVFIGESDVMIGVL